MKRVRTSAARPAGERGMTIVELMVAMAISSILIILVFDFFSTQAANYTENRQMAELQQELRWGMNFLSDRIKLAGNGVPPTSGWDVLENVDGAAGAPDSISIIGSFKNLVVSTTQPMGNSGAPIKVTSTDDIEIGDICVISDGTFQEIFMVTDKNSEVLLHDEAEPWNSSKFLDHKYTQDSNITVVTYYSFFVGTDDDGRTSLMVQTQAYNPQPLISDVEDFQIRFKMKDNTWVNETEQIYDIRMIEITVRARSPEPIKNYTDPVYGDSYKHLEMKTIVIPKNIVIYES